MYSNGEIKVLGVSVATEREAIESRIRTQLEEVRQTLGLARDIPSGCVEVLDDYIGSGYGIPTEAMHEAVSLVARSEGIVIDPVYTGKAMAGLIAQIRAGRFGPDDVVVFLHTGGTPALFADAQIESFAQTDLPL